MDESPYYKSLLRWISAAKEYLNIIEDNVMFYGTGDSVWGIHTHKKALAVFAVAAGYDCFDEDVAGMSRQEAERIGLSLFRYALRTHIEGDMLLTDGKKWGHTWISGLGLERIMHGIERLLPQITHGEYALLKRILVSECDWLCDEYTIEAERYNNIDKTGFVADYGKTNVRNKPESNIWNGAELLRTAMMFPELPRAEEYIDRGTRFLVNGISVKADVKSSVVYNGKTVAEMFVGDNFFESYALDHHGYLNLGYAAICLSNIAMLHYAYKKRGMQTPKVLFHHVEELWRFVKACTFNDGTLARIGGDARTRYCYCQDYMVPALIFAKNVLQDPIASDMEEKWMQKVIYEQSLSSDGSYLLERCSALKDVSPLYYTRLETDRALSCSLGFEWNSMLAGKVHKSRKSKKGIMKKWSEPYHGACLLRSNKRFVSWCWRGAQGPTGMCVPLEESSMAEYQHNMFPEILSNSQVEEIIKEKEYNIKMLDNSFLTLGRAETYALKFYAEAEEDKLVAEHEVAVAALPDDRTLVVLQRSKTCHRSYLKSVKGGYLLVQNDIFNHGQRTIYYEGGRKALIMASGGDVVNSLGSRWLNIDNKLGVILLYGAESLSLYRPSHRQIGIAGRKLGEEMLYADEICIAPRMCSFWAHANEYVVDAGFAVKAGIAAEETRNDMMMVGGSILQCDNSEVRCAVIMGADNKLYAMAANFGQHTAQIYSNGDLSLIGRLSSSANDADLPPGDLALFAVKSDEGD